ncbi:MAG TPA: NAD(P)/FAD-dependent oxidoreductase [Firmicutes bacterium]|nr:NAD(P)/FAD-dependent oxidoreductase [Bacillota bacterium]
MSLSRWPKSDRKKRSSGARGERRLGSNIAIIGGGPAGIFSALELNRLGKKNVIMFEKGHDIEKRKSPLKNGFGQCKHCSPCSIVCGWGGAGAYSDGKLTLTPDFGGFLDEYLSREELDYLIKYVDEIYLSFGADTALYGQDEQAVKEIQKRAAAADLKFIPAPIRHLGTDRCREILSRMRSYLENKITIKTLTPVEEILADKSRVTGVRAGGRVYPADYVICGPGREGSAWFYREAARLGLNMTNNPVDIGLRVEVPADILEEITDKIYESKFIYYAPSFDDRVRTFCMNPYGEVVIENNSGLITVNGHSYAGKKSKNTNFALLVSKTFTEPFKEPIAYGKYIASLANMLGGGVLVQRLGDLLAGRRSTAERINRGLVKPSLLYATPGDLSLVLPYRHLKSILEMLEALDKIIPGINSRHTLLYGVEVKFYSFRLNLSKELETEVKNLFAVGDGAGITRGLAQASATGILAARQVARRQEEEQ